MDIVEALSADAGLTAVVGAGGKKTTLYALADRLERAVVTATVRIPIFDDQVARVVVADDPVDALGGVASRDYPLGLVPEREREDRYRGYDPTTVDRLAAAHDGPVLVKADGARTRWLKAPNDREPQIPGSADTVVPVASVRVVGELLTDERVHRPELVAELAGIDLGEELRPEHVARVLASDRGGLKGVPAGATAAPASEAGREQGASATVVPLVNMVDDERLEATAREVAREVLARSGVPRVVLARMTAAEPLVDVVTRE